MFRVSIVLLAAGLCAVQSFAQQDVDAGRYMGREIARTMSYHGAGWLIRSDRNDEENTVLAFKELQLKKGMTVCDLGCGNGYYALQMAKAVGEDGKVLAVDIQREMLKLLDLRAKEQSIGNVKPILGKIDNPNLPKDEVDLVLLVDVYHEFSHPVEMLGHIRRSLSKTGVVALLEYRTEDVTVPIKRLHKMPKKQIMREYGANGLKLVREFNGLPWQHMMFFARDDSPLKEIQPKQWAREAGTSGEPANRE